MVKQKLSLSALGKFIPRDKYEDGDPIVLLELEAASIQLTWVSFRIGCPGGKLGLFFYSASILSQVADLKSFAGKSSYCTIL